MAQAAAPALTVHWAASRPSPAGPTMLCAYARLRVCIAGARLGRSPGRPPAGGDRAGPLSQALVALALTLTRTRTQTQTRT